MGYIYLEILEGPIIKFFLEILEGPMTCARVGLGIEREAWREPTKGDLLRGSGW